MASCGYSAFVGENCGSSSSNPANVQCVTIGNCNKDIKTHLKRYKVWDSSLNTEARLLLARAGNSKHSTFCLFVLHRVTGLRYSS